MVPQSRQPITHIPTGTRVRKLMLGVALAAAPLLGGCGGGSGGDSTAPVAPPATPAASGVFIDAPVAGLDYATPSSAGSTDEEGRFLYTIGESLSFSIGASLQLGQATGGAMLSPLDLVPAPAGYIDPRVKAVASLLQSLDADATVDNGIALTAEIKRLVTETLGDERLDLAAIYTLSDAELAAALAGIDTLTRSLVDAANAQGLPLQYVDPDTAEGNLVAGLAASMETVAAFDPAWGSDGAFTDATSCDQCHAARDGEDALRDAQGNDISPPHDWRHGIMAHAFDDPYFQAVMEEESRYRFPQLAGAIEDKCLSCHAPMGHLNAHSSGAGLDADGYYRYAQAVQDMDAREAIGCTLCHQIEATTSDSDGQPVVGDDAQGGHFSIGSARIIYGPYGGPGDIAVTAGPMQVNVDYTPQYGHQLTESGYCASCHTVTTPVIDIDTGLPAEPAREFLEQAPYQEWQNSVFSRGSTEQRQECQDCHMPIPDPDYQTAIALRPPNQVERSPYFRHTLAGGNTYMLELLQRFGDVLGIEATTSDAGFAEQIAATRALLTEASAAIAITRVEQVGDATLEVDIAVTNYSGHKLPTSYPSRRVWVHLRVRDDSRGATVFESGAPGADGGIATDSDALAERCFTVDKPADFSNDGCYEPHRDRIDSEQQVAIYETTLADTRGHITQVLLYADSYLKDNRIPPQGFTGDAVVGATGVVGVTSEDIDFNRDADGEGSGSDSVHYLIPLAGAAGPFTVEARLLYQAIKPAFVKKLSADSGRVMRFKQMYQMLPPTVETLAAATAISN
jgi:hypothetical protein